MALTAPKCQRILSSVCSSLVIVMAGLTVASPACLNDYVPNVAAIQRSQSVLDQLQIESMTTIRNLEALRHLVSELDGLAGQPAA